ncbi:MAG: aminoacetone oxidase family FAD-binding enzyme [Clostridiales Family XIII bacterium]|jgi:predicted Rossmann fold flavoprotein|nr:aminoacetone oxidase family FAD-binding enzyme [Clostridiales Family XIII bacterium]
MREQYDLIIIGGGAAGLSAAVSYARACRGRVVILDGNAAAGKKITTTGNGRCNLTNVAAAGYEDTKKFFESLGIVLSMGEEGRIYPLNRQASSVRDALVRETVRYGISVRTSTKALSLRSDNSGFTVQTESAGDFFAPSLVIATGGKACPQYGNLGEGYVFARKLGHEIRTIQPALVPMVYAETMTQALAPLKGVRAHVQVKLLNGGRAFAAEAGEIQFTEYGLSGICIFDLSRFLRRGEKRVGSAEFTVVIDFTPELTTENLEELLLKNTVAGLGGIVNRKIAELFESLLQLKEPPAFSDRETARRAAVLVKNFEVPVSGTKGWKEAQITSGGVSLKEINPDTFESLLISGLYFAGEVLDYDGPCGGYNLDFAWNSGMRAGKAAAYAFTR